MDDLTPYRVDRLYAYIHRMMREHEQFKKQIQQLEERYGKLIKQRET